jgi:NADH dehydrogenase
MNARAASRPRVVIVGGGFAGLTAARALRGRAVEVTIIDRQNHHLFQPLLYQVATAALSPADIASPIRSVLRGQKNATILLGDVMGFDLNARVVQSSAGELTYDYLIVAAGAENNYFGHPQWETIAVGLKDIDEAVEIRRRVLVALEAAERESDEAKQRELLTFVVIGAGPTGVEMAGALQELSTYLLSRDFRRVTPHMVKVVLVEGGPRVLPTFPAKLSASAQAELVRLGVDVRLDCKVTDIDAQGVHYAKAGTNLVLPSPTVMWTAGVRASPLAAMLGLPTDKGGRVAVGSDCTIAGRPEVFVLGDMAAQTQDGHLLPGVAPVAMQQGRYAARAIADAIAGRAQKPFHYVDKGSLATIGRSDAVAWIGKIQLSGFLAWLVWIVVHIFYLIGFRNRIAVMLQWAWSYLTFQRGARLITGHRLDAGAPAETSVGQASSMPRAG